MLLAAFDSYSLVIAGALVIIISFFFNMLAKKTNIPSVLMLIVLGILAKLGMDWMGVRLGDLDDELEVIGIVGLIMIVLEAALELKLTKEKWPIIWKSFVVALLSLVLSTFACAMVINFFILHDTFQSLLFAIPLSIMSSAIILPSVASLPGDKKEFMVYEGTFSDILGIMFFYFLVDNAGATSTGVVVGKVLGNIILTVVLSVVLSYGLIWLFQKLKSQVKLFLLIAVLVLFYAIGKKFHLSSLVMILIFGLILNNRSMFFKGMLKPLLDEEAAKRVVHDLHIVTLETAFVVRTFFFVIFGVTISLGSLIDIEVAFYSAILILALYGVRMLVLKVFKPQDMLPEMYLAPRGLITILLFFSIPIQYQSSQFDPGILLYSILVTSTVMTWALISYAKERVHIIDDEVLPDDDDVDESALVVQADAGGPMQSATHEDSTTAATSAGEADPSSESETEDGGQSGDDVQDQPDSEKH